MRGKIALISASVLILSSASIISAGETEQDIVNRFLKRTEAKHTRQISWVAVNSTFNRINRDNDYNKFAICTSPQFSNTSIPWIGNAKSFGIDAGLSLGKSFAWSIGGEYWLKLGTDQTGSFDYTPPGGASMVIDNLVSEVKVWGVSSSLMYYFYNSPSKTDVLKQLAVRVDGSVGYYQASWDLWDGYQNLNLATSVPEGVNTTLKGTAPGFSFGVGADYPLPFFDMALGVDVSYLYLNFTNVAWYNAEDEEIVATYNGTADSRVDLNLSGARARIELKRFFKL